MRINSNSPDEKIEKAFKHAVRKSIRDNKRKGNPICGYDTEKRKSYIQYPNGEKVYAEA